MTFEGSNNRFYLELLKKGGWGGEVGIITLEKEHRLLQRQRAPVLSQHEHKNVHISWERYGGHVHVSHVYGSATHICTAQTHWPM